MPKELERDLGLYATLTISVGAMIGSGIFVLPGKAAGIAGPSVILAYLLAGLLVLPAALSKAEMATAMPESGGTYLYIDRAMGPLPGTVAGVGAWFSLVFKSAFALVGLGSYLLVFVPGLRFSLRATVLGVTYRRPGIVLVALALAVVILAVNAVGVKQSGRMQAGIVTVVLLSLSLFIADGITYVDRPNYHPFFTAGTEGLLAATGFVFVSYAGVTKIASVAEEVEAPGRNIPLGILGSIAAMMLVYTLVVFVVVGVTPAAALTKTLTPMAVAAGEFGSPTIAAAVSLVAVLALTSMANAGVLSSSRFPLAMSRDDLAPAALREVHPRFGTPVWAIGATGVLLVSLIAFVPVVQLAKLASAFQILVFALVNAALVAFRESDIATYDPEFVSPGYPWVQLAGIAGAAVLIPQLGPVALGGAVALVALGVVWYRIYGRAGTEREGAALDAIRRRTGDLSLEAIRELFQTGGQGGVLVALGSGAPVDRESGLLQVAAALVRRRGGGIEVARFEEVPQQTSLPSAVDRRTPADEAFERATAAFGSDLPVPVEATEVVTHDLEHALVNHVEHTGMNLLVGEWELERFTDELLDRDVDWYIEHAPCDLVLVRDRGLSAVETIVVVADKGAYDPLEVLVADAMAVEHGADIRFVYAAPENASEEQLAAVETYHRDLAALCSGATSHAVVATDDKERALVDAARGADIVVVSPAPRHVLYDVVFGTVAHTLATELDCTLVLAHSRAPRRHTFLRYLLERVAF